MPLPAAVLASVPVDLDREAARDAVLRELADPRYAADDPNLAQRVSRWLFERIGDVLDRAVAATPGGAWGLLLAAMIAAAVATVLLIAGRRVLAERRAGQRGADLFTGSAAMTAQQHRDLAREAAAAEDWTTALVEGFRALVRTLDEQGRWMTRASRTADEAATEAATLFPEQSESWLQAARRFDAVLFGRQSAGPADHALVAALDRALLTDQNRPRAVAEPVR
jgi:hypothetical protein